MWPRDTHVALAILKIERSPRGSGARVVTRNSYPKLNQICQAKIELEKVELTYLILRAIVESLRRNPAQRKPSAEPIILACLENLVLIKISQVYEIFQVLVGFSSESYLCSIIPLCE